MTFCKSLCTKFFGNFKNTLSSNDVRQRISQCTDYLLTDDTNQHSRSRSEKNIQHFTHYGEKRLNKIISVVATQVLKKQFSQIISILLKIYIELFQDKTLLRLRIHFLEAGTLSGFCRNFRETLDFHLFLEDPIDFDSNLQRRNSGEMIRQFWCDLAEFILAI